MAAGGQGAGWQSGKMAVSDRGAGWQSRALDWWLAVQSLRAHWWLAVRAHKIIDETISVYKTAMKVHAESTMSIVLQ